MTRGVIYLNFTFWLACIALGANPFGFADPNLDVALSAKKIHLDQTVLLSIQIEWPKTEADYSFALPELPLKNLTIVRQGESEEVFTRDGGEWTRKTFEIELQAPRKGRGSI